jgi:hypothetical protein
MKIRVSGILLRYTEYCRVVDCEAATVVDGLDKLCRDYPALRRFLFTGDGTLSRVHQLFLNGEKIDKTNLNQPVHPEDTLEVLTAVAGC